MLHPNLSLLSRTLWAAGVLLASLPSQAQQADNAERKPGALQEITVTATKVATPASKTPVSLSVVGGEDLKSAGITEARALEEVAPNVQIAQESGKLQIAIRGVVSLDMTEKGDPSAAFNIDGAYIARYEAQVGAFMDLERIEVLRGPQGTLYGRNATAGAINLITAKPGKRLEGRVEADIGNFGARRFEGMLNVPLSDMWKLRAVAQKSERDGYVLPGPNAGKTPMDERDDYAARVHLLGQFTPDTSLLLTAETSHQGGGSPTPVPMGNFFTGKYQDNLPFSPPNSGNNIGNAQYIDRGDTVQRTAGGNFKGTSDPAFTDNDNDSLRGEFKTSLGFADLTYQLAYLKGKIDGSGNGIYFGFPIVLKGRGDSDSTSHEIRLNSNGNGALKWVAGAYLFKEDIHRESSFTTHITAPFGSFQVYLPFNIDVTNKSSALFGQATWSMSPATRLTAGLRETRDEKSGTDKFGGVAPAPGATTSAGAYSKTVKFSNTSFRLGVDHDLAPGTMVYGSVATGYKAGGFNDTSDGGNYKPEHLTALELGVKTRVGERLQLTAGLFHYDYKDMQQTSVVCKTADPSSCGSVTNNAASSKADGAEVEARWLVADNGQLRVSLALNEAKFKDYKPAANVDWSGQRLDRAPKSVLALGYSHRFGLASGAEVVASVNTRFNSGYSISDPAAGLRYVQPSFHKSDASVAWNSADTKVSVQAYVKNIEQVNTLESRVPGSFFLGDPRTFGVRASYSF